MEMGGWIGVVKPQEICEFNLVEDVMVVTVAWRSLLGWTITFVLVAWCCNAALLFGAKRETCVVMSGGK